MLISAYYFFESRNLMPDKYYCPRCKSEEVIDLGKVIACTNCKDESGVPLEFEKDLIGKIPDDEILSRQSLSGFLGAFEELKDSKKRERFLDDVIQDLNEDN